MSRLIQLIVPRREKWWKINLRTICFPCFSCFLCSIFFAFWRASYIFVYIREESYTSYTITKKERVRKNMPKLKKCERGRYRHEGNQSIYKGTWVARGDWGWKNALGAFAHNGIRFVWFWPRKGTYYIQIVQMQNMENTSIHIIYLIYLTGIEFV